MADRVPLGLTGAARTRAQIAARQSQSVDTSSGRQSDQPPKKKDGKLYLRYPLDSIFDSTDYFRFYVVKYVPPGLGAAAAAGQILQSGGAPLQASNSEISNKGSDRRVIHDRSKTIIDLPMPLALSDKTSVGWSDGQMNTVTSLVGSFAQQLMDSKGSFTGNIKDAVNELTTRLSAAGMGGMVQIAQNALVSMMINMVPGTGQFGFTDVLQRQSGLVINPNTEFLFNAPKLRQFNFTFTFVPRSEKEAQMVKDIIRNFKKHMAPKRTITNISGNVGGGFLQAPDIFKLEYRTGNNPHQFLNKFKFCALTNMVVNYSGGNGYMSYEDGTPVLTTITLGFNELTPIYAEDYDTDYAKGGVGF
jgi:hypothetical protein